MILNIIRKLIYKYPQSFKYHYYRRLNRLKFKLSGIKFGNNIQLYNKIHLKISPTAIFVIGDNFTFSSGNAYNPICRNIEGCIYVSKGACLIIGNNVGISSACIWVNKSITIGDNVKIGGDCIIMDTDAHNLNYNIRNSNELNENGELIDAITAKNAPIIIEDDVLIGARCILLKGITIGARSVIGAGSVVTSSIPSNTIAAGNPCRIIRKIE